MSQTYAFSPTIVKTGANITTSAASAAVTIPTNLSGLPPSYIRVSATAAAYVKIAPSAAVAVAGDVVVQPGDALILSVPAGVTSIAALQVAAAGIVQVSALENS